MAGDFELILAFEVGENRRSPASNKPPEKNFLIAFLATWLKKSFKTKKQIKKNKPDVSLLFIYVIYYR